MLDSLDNVKKCCKVGKTLPQKVGFYLIAQNFKKVQKAEDGDGCRGRMPHSACVDHMRAGSAGRVSLPLFSAGGTLQVTEAFWGDPYYPWRVVKRAVIYRPFFIAEPWSGGRAESAGSSRL